MDFLQDLLFDMEDGKLESTPCEINWNNGIEEDDVVAESVTPEISPAGVMGWITGKKHRELGKGPPEQITLKFDHECLARDPNHTICFPIVSACAMQISLPLQHMKTYDNFKNIFLLGFTKGQAFARKTGWPDPEQMSLYIIPI
ncbi:hypothetical protein AC249_AIPGENE11446 [Exaiptasia diaphana]|nr:hypothetical protein AC249_AIPGENE11446 [Exaiptasia diaphana]